MKPKVRVVPITQLVLDEKNANKGTKRGRELLEESDLPGRQARDAVEESLFGFANRKDVNKAGYRHEKTWLATVKERCYNESGLN